MGKYRTTLAKLPLQKEAIPCSAATRVKQLPIPVYLGISPLLMRGLESCTGIKQPPVNEYKCILLQPKLQGGKHPSNAMPHAISSVVQA